MNKAGLLSFDFDGTLYSASEGKPVPSGLIDIIKTLERQQFSWGINTGRSLDFLLEGLNQSGMDCMPYYVIAREREVYLLGEGGYVADENWNKKMSSDHQLLFKRYADVIMEIKHFVLRETKAQWISEPGDEAGIIATNLKEMEKILEMLDSCFHRYEELDYLHNTIYLRLTHRDYHKGTTLSYMANRLGVEKSKVFAIGDGANDLGMLDAKYVGMMACPANAVEAVKTRVKEQLGYISTRSVADGAIDALWHFYSKQLADLVVPR